MAKKSERQKRRRLPGVATVALVVLGCLLLVREVVSDEGSATHAAFTGVAAVILGVLLSWLFLWAVREQRWTSASSPSNDVMGFIYATIGVVYGVIFAFVVVTTWQQFEDARALEDSESHAVADLFRLLPGLPEAERDGVRLTLVEYARAAIDVEWPEMAGGDSSGAATLALIDRMWQIYGNAATGPTAESELYDKGLDRLADLSDIRRERLHANRHGIPGMLWAALIVGAVVTVGFAAGFSVESWVVHAWLVAALSALISLFLLVTVELDRPYSGDIRVAPDQFRAVLEQFAPESAVQD